MASVTLSSVGVTFPDGSVGLDGIDLEVADGEFIALVGASGSGKTTLLRVIAGFLDPTAGLVRIDDELMADGSTAVPPERRRLGMVFQQQAVWPHWNVGRNVAYPLGRDKVPAAERRTRVSEVLDLVGLGGMESRNPATLSGGQRQRVALARALVGSPRVLLLDEALSALDEPLRDSLRLELQRLTRAAGLTVVHVTHDREEALALADRVVVLGTGRVLQIGSPGELVHRPVSPRVAAFLSDATVFAGERTADGFEATAHPCRVPGDVIETVEGETTAKPGALAVLPEQVELVVRANGAATVVSSLFGRSGSDVVVDWSGTPLRCRVDGRRPAVGERVDVVIRGALFYPGA